MVKLRHSDRKGPVLLRHSV